MKDLLRRFTYAELSIFAVAALSIAALLFCSFFTYPSGDDYGYAYKIQQEGYMASCVDSYLTWSGRYMATFLGWLNPLLYNAMWMFTVFVALMVTGLVVATYFFVNQAITYAATRAKLLTTAFIACLLFAGMPSIFEGFYWFSAYISYTLPCMAILVAMAIGMKHERESTAQSRWLLIVSYLLIPVIVGCNELTLIAFDCLVAFLIVNKWQNRQPVGFLWIWFAIAAVGSAAMLFAPGNFVCWEQCDVTKDVWHIVSFSLIFTVMFLGKYLPLMAIATLVYVIAIAPLLPVAKTKIRPMVFLAFGISTIFLMHLFMFLSTDTRPLERTENVPFVFLVFVTMTFVHIATPSRTVQAMGKPRNGMFTCIATVLFLFFMFRFDSSINMTCADILSGKVTQFAKDRQRQIDIMKASDQHQTEVPSVTVAPKTLTYTIYNDALTLNRVMIPGEPFYGTTAVFPIDTIHVEDSRAVWNRIKTRCKLLLGGTQR